MFEDGLIARDREDVKVFDIAEVLLSVCGGCIGSGEPHET